MIESRMSSKADQKVNTDVRRASLTYTNNSEDAQQPAGANGGAPAAPTSPTNFGLSDTDDDAVRSPKQVSHSMASLGQNLIKQHIFNNLVGIQQQRMVK